MIRKILTTYAARLDEYLARSHRQPEGVAEVGLIGSAGEQCPNKLVVSLINLEREASGDGGYMQRAATGYAGRRQPLLLNMHIMMAAVYEDKVRGRQFIGKVRYENKRNSHSGREYCAR